MADLMDQFEQAVTDSKELPKRPDNDTLLQLYGLYKQSTIGDVTGKRPGRFAMVDRAKFDAWAKMKGTSADDAKQQYIDLIDSLKA